MDILNNIFARTFGLSAPTTGGAGSLSQPFEDLTTQNEQVRCNTADNSIKPFDDKENNFLAVTESAYATNGIIDIQKVQRNIDLTAQEHQSKVQKDVLQNVRIQLLSYFSRRQVHQIEEIEREARVAEAQRLTDQNDVRVFLHDARTLVQEQLLARVNGLVADLAAQHEREARVQADILKTVVVQMLAQANRKASQFAEEHERLRRVACNQHLDVIAEIESVANREFSRDLEEIERYSRLMALRPYMTERTVKVQEQLLHSVHGKVVNLATEGERQRRMQAERHRELLSELRSYANLSLVRALEERERQCRIDDAQRLADQNDVRVFLHDARTLVQEQLLARVNGLVADLAAQHEREARVQADFLKTVNSQLLSHPMLWNISRRQLQKIEDLERVTRIAEDFRLVYLNDSHMQLQEELLCRVNGLAADHAAQEEREVRIQADRLKRVHAEWLERCGQDTLSTSVQAERREEMHEALCHRVNGLLADVAAQEEREARTQVDRLKNVHVEWLERCGREIRVPVNRLNSMVERRSAAILEEQERVNRIVNEPTSTEYLAELWGNASSAPSLARTTMHEELLRRVNGLLADLSVKHERESRVQSDHLKLVNAEWLDRCGQPAGKRDISPGMMNVQRTLINLFNIVKRQLVPLKPIGTLRNGTFYPL